MAKSNSSKKILIVEDDADQIMIYQTAFKNAGYSVLTASSCEEARKVIEKESPDLVLLDLLLEKDNGISILKRMKEKGCPPNTKIVIFTNFFKKNLAEECKRLGAKDFISKMDFVPSEIVKRVADCL